MQLSVTLSNTYLTIIRCIRFCQYLYNSAFFTSLGAQQTVLICWFLTIWQCYTVVHTKNLLINLFSQVSKTWKRWVRSTLCVQNVYLVESQNSKAHYRILLFQAVLKMTSYTLLPYTKVILCVLQRNLSTISVNLSTVVWPRALPKLSTSDKSREKTWWNENLACSIIIFLSLLQVQIPELLKSLLTGNVTATVGNMVNWTSPEFIRYHCIQNFSIPVAWNVQTFSSVQWTSQTRTV